MAVFSFVYYHSFIKVRPLLAGWVVSLLHRCSLCYYGWLACCIAGFCAMTCHYGSGVAFLVEAPTNLSLLQVYNVNGILETIFSMQPEAQHEIYQHLTSYLKTAGRLP